MEQDKNIIAFDSMLKTFHSIIKDNPTAEKAKDKLLSLKESASNNIDLNVRQKDAIIARCDNYLNGTYGKTKTANNLSYGSPTIPPSNSKP